MKKLLITIAVVLSFSVSYADQYVNGHFRSNGTYVSPYYRSTPDSNPWNNYSTKGNINPYTGKQGTKNPYNLNNNFNNNFNNLNTFDIK